MNSQEALTQLVCGLNTSNIEDEGSSAIHGLESIIQSYYSFQTDFQANINTPQASYFMPVALRSLMESSAIALLARVDPLRVILSSKSQDSSEYKKTHQQPSAISWRNDIAGDVKGPPPANAPQKGIWDPSISSSKLPRHLLSENMIDAIWIPAARNLSNFKDPPNSNWLNEILSQDSKDIIPRIIGDGNMLYSELSKGIHPEFAVRREAEYDGPTLQVHVEKTMKWIGSLAVLSHFASSFNNKISTEAAVAAFILIEEASK